MLTVDQIGEYFRVGGYADGSDWWVLLPHSRDEFSYGIAGPAHVWYAERSGRIHILHALDRQPLATLQLEGYSPTGLRVPVTASRDGRWLYVLEWLGAVAPGQGRVHVVDVSAGAVTAVHGPLPARYGDRPHERPDGRLLLPTLRQSLVLLDPMTGEWTESTVPGAPGAGNFWNQGSPDGRYWIRFDPAALPLHEATPGFLARLRGKTNTERRYGLTLQIWEAFPLRFLMKTQRCRRAAHFGTPWRPRKPAARGRSTRPRRAPPTSRLSPRTTPRGKSSRRTSRVSNAGSVSQRGSRTGTRSG
jgi:hypothetical protein